MTSGVRPESGQPQAAAAPAAAAAPMPVDVAFAGAQRGDTEAFAAWMARVEGPLRRSLRPFAYAVDVEAVLQEGLMRMWRAAPALELKGSDASLRYALRVVRNLAISEARRLRRLAPLDLDALEQLPEGRVEPDPVPDAGLRRIILECIEKLPPRPRQALRHRMSGYIFTDRDIAEMLDMTVNTFLQNIVRARRLVAKCLGRQDVHLEGIG